MLQHKQSLRAYIFGIKDVATALRKVAVPLPNDLEQSEIFTKAAVASLQLTVPLDEVPEAEASIICRARHIKWDQLSADAAALWLTSQAFAVVPVAVASIVDALVTDGFAAVAADGHVSYPSGKEPPAGDSLLEVFKAPQLPRREPPKIPPAKAKFTPPARSQAGLLNRSQSDDGPDQFDNSAACRTHKSYHGQTRGAHKLYDDEEGHAPPHPSRGAKNVGGSENPEKARRQERYNKAAKAKARQRFQEKKHLDDKRKDRRDAKATDNNLFRTASMALQEAGGK